MNVFSNKTSISENLIQSGVILIIGSVLGMFAIPQVPFSTFVGTAVFAVLAIFLYTSSYFRQQQIAAPLSTGAAPTNTVLFYLFYLAFFLSVTIPKSGRTVSGIPITTANMVLLLALVCWSLQTLFSRKKKRTIPFLKPLIIFILYGIFSFLLGILNGNHVKFIVLDFVTFVGFIPVYFLVCHVLQTQQQLKKIVVVILLSLSLVCLYGVLQPRLGFERIAIPGITQQMNMATYGGIQKWNFIEGGGQKVYSTFQNGNVFGNHLALFIPFVGGLLMGISSFRKRMIVTGVFLLSCYTLMITYSRGALVGALSGIFCLIIISKKVRFKALIIIFIVISLLLTILYYYADRPELSRYNFRRAAEDPDRFSAGRIQGMRVVFTFFSQFTFAEKLFGRGFGGGLADPQYSDYVDSLYLTLLFKIGLVGLALLFWLLLLFLFTLFRQYSRSQNSFIKGIIAGGFGGMIGSLIHNLADTLWLFPPLAANFWFLTGITSVAVMLGAKESVPEASAETSTQRVSQRMRNKMARYSI